MSEPFKMTPAARVFGMGLPRRKVENPGSIFGIDVDEPRWSLDPRLRQDMFEQQQLSMQEQALDAQQKQLQRQMQVQEAEDAAMNDIASGEEIGNIFRKNPALALSRNFGQFAALAQPSKATRTLAPSLLEKLPPQYHGMFNELIQTQEHAQDPLGAYSKVRTQEEIDKQRGRLRKAGVDTSGLEKRLYLPEEEEDLVIKSSPKERDPEIKAMEEYLDFLQKEKASLVDSGGDLIRNPNAKKGDDTIPLNLPSPKFLELQKELDEVGQLYRSKKRGLFMPKQAATAENIASPDATGGGEQDSEGTFQQKMQKASTPSTPSGAPTLDLESAAKNEQLANIGSINEDGLAKIIESDQFSLAQKEKALESLKALEKAKFPNLDLDAVKAKKENIKALISDLEPILKDARIFEKEVMPAYSKAMNDIETLVGLYAEQNGLDPSNIYRSLEKEVAPSGELSAKGFSIAFDVLGEELAKTNNTYLGKVLEKENKSKSTSQPIRSFLKRVFGGNQVNNAKILGRLAKERIGNRVTPEWGGGEISMDVGLESSSKADEIARQYLPKK